MALEPQVEISEVPEETGEGVEVPASSGLAPWVRLLGLAAMLVTGAIYFLRIDQVVGWMMDDAWYVLLAQSLATGQGYRLINAPTPGILPLYPPGFPFLLSLVYRLFPQFPENVWLLKSVSVLAVLGCGALLFHYFYRQRQLPVMLAMGIALAACLCPPLVFLATSTVMSDCVFMLLLVAGIVLAERLVAKNPARPAYALAIGLGALSGFAFLTRSIGIALGAGIFLYLLKERLLKSALLFGLTAALVVGPWMLYSRVHAPTNQQQMEQGGYIVQPYSMQFWQKLAGDRYSGGITASELPQRVLNNSLEFLGRDVCRILAAVVFEAVRDPIKDAEKVNSSEAGTHGEILPVSLLLGLIVLIGFFFTARERLTAAEFTIPLILAVVVLWPFETVRYVLPLAPFVIFYFVMGLRALLGLIGRAGVASQWRLAYGFLVLILALNLFGNVRYLLNLNAAASYDRPLWVTRFDEAQDLFKQIKERVPQNEVVGTTIPALVHLYTGRKTVAWEDPAGKWDMWKTLGVKHYAWLLFYPRQPDPAERKFRTTWVSRGGGNLRLIDLGAPESRPSWSAP